MDEVELLEPLDKNGERLDDEAIEFDSEGEEKSAS